MISGRSCTKPVSRLILLCVEVSSLGIGWEWMEIREVWDVIRARSFISRSTGGTVTALTPNLVVITWLDCGVTDVKAKEFCLRIQMHYQDCQQSDCVLIYFESLTIQKVRIPPRMSQLNKILRPLRVALTLGPHLIITILCWQAITLHLHLKERRSLSRKGAGQY